MKHIEEVPWWICDEGDTNYCAYSDTDSIYIDAEALLRHLYPNFDEMLSEEKDEALEKLALKYHPDKNPSPDSSTKFIQIQSAYDIFDFTKWSFF